ncbi:alpha/beta fold hydrolase [Lancefieldella sp. Marseille-Q7238]|uniref:acetylxylan esterase n=1 Tax=Lancefieldella sp. Marseille-Q7238 TaxID=3022127 RepID=UPI0024A82993|nr:alpha/beta fold hydrolase [Lancefieldella sp. Marseille-Q7238]
MSLSKLDYRELRVARALAPMSADFSEFWEARMAEADAVPLSWRLEPSDEVAQAKTCAFCDLWFDGMKGAKLYAKFLYPHGEKNVPLVLQFHGYPGASRSWFEQASFVGAGCALLALDNPGQGGRSYDGDGYAGTTVAGHLVAGLDGPAKDLYYVRLYQNVRILCRIVCAMDGIDLKRVFVNGQSQGGGMGIACCALNQELVNRAAILFPFLSDFRAVWELGADKQAYEGIRYYTHWFDPRGERVDEIFGKLAYVDSANFARFVRCPVLFGSGLDDEVCPLPTQFAVYNALECPKRHLLFEDYGHEEIQAFDDRIIGFFDAQDARSWLAEEARS